MVNEVLLATFRVCGVDVPVVETDDVPSGCMDDGCFWYPTSTIYIKRGLSPTRRRDVLLHEWLHAFFDLSGIRTWLEAIKQKELEEQLCRFITPAITTAIDAGLLTLMGSAPDAGPAPAASSARPAAKKAKASK